ncbi:hypothetical protein [Sphingobacterium paucimobilis]|uniref:Uncharacterized protein n=1 Tax=Sphingobacterium paucimobilis HER1398 TaxID=1346330 RepID=U2HTZ4_9SPHI|nr:hypothetical protein [Sphingobacterium paucimobilis]ERJ58750.1 hypothetical protein M472_08210 [Sphingobacterium paucimobilis HER1398]
MKREQIQKWLDEGYQILSDGEPKGIEGSLLDNVNQLNDEQPQVFMLTDLLTWSDDQLDKLDGFSDEQIEAMDS